MKKNLIRQVFVIKGRIENDQKTIDLLQQKITKTNHLHIKIVDSPGGDANITVRMLNILAKFKKAGGTITTHTKKRAASSALLLHLQGSKRTTTPDSVFTIDLPFKIPEQKIVLGYKETEVLLKKLLAENDTIIKARQQWAEKIAEHTHLSPDLVFKLEGYLFGIVDAYKIGFCNT